MRDPAIFLPFDTETGGITEEASLLTANFVVCDKNWNIIDELDLSVKPNDGQYVVSAEAMQINKINLIEHDQLAMTYSQAGARLREFLLLHSQNGKIKLQPMGKNVGFDVKKVINTILGAKTFYQFVSYRNYDITPLITYLKRTDRLAPDAPESLEGMARHLGMDVAFHTARADNLAGIEVIKYLESL